MTDAITRAVEALNHARMFIENGVELGYVSLPTAPDPALDTLPKVNASLAALTVLQEQPAPVGVKPLEWEFVNADSTQEKASTDLAHYVVWEIGGRGYLQTQAFRGGQAQAGGIEAAKAAAQADYERRILSALQPSPAPVGVKLVPVEPTTEMLDAYWKQTGESKEMRPRTHAYMKRYWSVMLDAAPSALQPSPAREDRPCLHPRRTG